MKSYLNFLSSNKLYTAIQAVGLVVSLTLVLIIGMSVRDQLGVAAAAETAGEGRLHLVYSSGSNELRGMIYREKEALSSFPEIQQAASYVNSAVTVGIDAVRYKMDVLVGDGALLEMFPLRAVSGSVEAVKKGSGIALSASAARRYFPDTDPIGQVLALGGNPFGGILVDVDPVPVVAVLETPGFTLLPDFEVFCPVQIETRLTNTVAGKDNGLGIVQTVFALLAPGVDAADFNAKYEGLLAEPASKLFFSGEGNETWRHGKLLYLIVLIVLGLVLLLSALLNYVNLSSAISGSRAREMAIRGVMGEEKKGIVCRIVLESILFTGLCYGLAVALAVAIIPGVNALFGNAISVPFRVAPHAFFWLFSAGLVLLIGGIAGLVQAALISSCRPIDVLSGAVRRRRKMTFNKVCIILQAALAMTLTVVAIAMSLQFKHLETLDTGTDPVENLFFFRYEQALSDPILPLLRDRLTELSTVEAVAFSSGIPAHFRGISLDRKDGKFFYINNISCDSTAFRLMGFRIKDAYTDVRPGTIWITEPFRLSSGVSRENPDVSLLLPENMLNITAIGGVIEEFRRLAVNSEDQDSGLQPSFRAVRIQTSESGSRGILVKTSSDRKSFKQDFFRIARELYASSDRGMPAFENAGAAVCGYLDEVYASDYEDLHRFVELAGLICIVAIFLAMLGLFAMSTWFASANAKEIAIRKVHGATIGGETARLLLKYMLYVAVAALVAIPVSIVLVRRFLEAYPERISGYAWVFGVSALIVFVAAFATVLWQTVKAAQTNPAIELKKE